MSTVQYPILDEAGTIIGATSTPPTPVATDSRSRFGIEWYATEADADAVASRWADYSGQANLGIAQVGRDKVFDRTVDGQAQYAVVVP